MMQQAASPASPTSCAYKLMMPFNLIWWYRFQVFRRQALKENFVDTADALVVIAV